MTYVAPTLEEVLNDFIPYMQCGTSYIIDCDDATPPFDLAGIQLGVSEIVTNLNFFTNFLMTYNANEFTWHQKQAMNSIRCAVFNGGDNMWNFAASIYYVGQEFDWFGYEADVL